MIIVFGADGMLGKYVVKVLIDNYTVREVTRNTIDLSETDRVKRWLSYNVRKDDIIVNCAGVIPQKSEDIEEMVKVNTLFPLLLDKLDNKVIHVSSDCVFAGKNFERYSENYPPDATSTYGMTKAMGEPLSKTVIRTSIIGEGGGLLQWVLDSRVKITGYTHHYWNGVTCLQLAKIINEIITCDLYWESVRHIFSEDVCTKFVLLQYIDDIYDLMLTIKEQGQISGSPSCYRVLNTWYDDEFEWDIPSIPKQIKEQMDFLDIN